MMILGVHAATFGGHLAGWRHPNAWPTSMMELDNIIELAKTAEAAKLDFLFMADGNGVRQMHDPLLFSACSASDRPSVFEPVTMYAALSQHTKHIGMVATATTSYEEPYTLARKFGSLDHLSRGRAGWNLVTTSYAEDAQNFSHAEHLARELRYDRAREFLDVTSGLWDSWDDGAFIQDKATGRYLDPAKVHVLNHAGRHFQVKGPLNMARPPQGRPVVFMAGQSEAGKELAAYGADAQFATSPTKADGQAIFADIKGRMPKYGRSPDSLKLLPGVSIFVGRTAAEADAIYDELQSLIEPELGMSYLSKILNFDLAGHDIDGPVPVLPPKDSGGTQIGRNVQAVARRESLTIRQTINRVLPQMSGNLIKGTAKHVADVMEDWYTSQACDGFVFQPPVLPRGLDDFCNLVVPELQRRGLFRREYAGTTLRDNLALQPPRNAFFPNG